MPPTSLLSLPNETLSQIILYASDLYAPIPYVSDGFDLWRRRKALVELAGVCKTLSSVCLKALYSELRCEISSTGPLVLDTLQKESTSTSVPSQSDTIAYAAFVRTLEITESDEGRCITNTRIGSRAYEDLAEAGERLWAFRNSASSGAHALRTFPPCLVNLPYEFNLLPPKERWSPSKFSGKAQEIRDLHNEEIDVLQKEEKIALLLRRVAPHLTNLKYYTDLLPSLTSPPTFSKLVNLQRLEIAAPTIDLGGNGEYTAFFLLPLPKDLFLDAFATSWQHLTHLKLSNCSFLPFTREDAQGNGFIEYRKPSFRLDTLDLKECSLPHGLLAWLTDSSIAAGSLRTLRLEFIRASPEQLRNVISRSGPLLDNLAISCDDVQHSLDDYSPNRDQTDRTWWKPCFDTLNTLKQLELRGGGITSAHFKSIPKRVWNELVDIGIHYTSSISPREILNALLAIREGSPLNTVRIYTREPESRDERYALWEVVAGKDSGDRVNWTKQEEHELRYFMMRSKNIRDIYWNYGDRDKKEDYFMNFEGTVAWHEKLLDRRAKECESAALGY